jgi:uncharacterized protein YqjF (DUF2071 family)
MTPTVTKIPRIVGYQNWRNLSFIHWRVAAEHLQSLVPPSLSIQQFDGSAWLGIVPFAMERVRPWWSPAVSGVSWFLETNVRTYVVDPHGVTGVWFFSLDANNRAAVYLARSFWHLPYKYGDLVLQASSCEQSSGLQQSICYTGDRRDAPVAEYRIETSVVNSEKPTLAEPGSLDHFLLERYVLFAQRRNGDILTAQVHHSPYPMLPVARCNITQSLTTAMGCSIPKLSVPDHVAFSPGVDVSVSPLTSVR